MKKEYLVPEAEIICFPNGTVFTDVIIDSPQEGEEPFGGGGNG